MLFIGIDSGLHSTKVVLIYDNTVGAEIVLENNTKTIDNIAREGLEIAMDQAGFSNNTSRYIVATGSFRSHITGANRSIPDSICIARGIYSIFPLAHTVLDLGTQKSIGIKCSEGKVRETFANDKCAGSTSLYLQVVSDILGISIDKMAGLSFNSTKSIEISSTCAVFVESEIISMIHSGEKIEDIVKGVYHSLALRLYSLLLHLRIEREVALSGGIAGDVGLRQSLEDQLGYNVLVPDKPQFVGALGAAIMARDGFCH